MKILRSLRIEKGLTQLELANALGRPQSFVSKYESGERRLEVVEFIDVCRALEEDPSRIITKLESELKHVF